MTRLEQEAPLEPITIELALVEAGVMEEAAASAEASFSSKLADDVLADDDPEAEEDNALAARSDNRAPEPHDDALDELTEPEPNEDEP
jgi:hypothetical protein